VKPLRKIRRRASLGLLKGKFLLAAGILAASMQFGHTAERPALIDRPSADSGPTQISVAIWVVDITKIDSAEQSFTADVVFVLQWRDPRLSHPSGGVAHYLLDEIWHPRVAMVNETNSVSHRLPESVEVDADGSVLYRQRYVGSFAQALHLESFPFDRQTFRLQLVAVRYKPNEVKFVPDQKWIDAGLKQAAGISPSITLPDWTVSKWNTRSFVYTLAPGLENSGYVFEFTASRNARHYIFKVILPLILIVMMSWAVFWIDPVTSNSQISIAVTSMLTLIAYRFAVDSQLPRVPYTTRLDAFILTSTVLVFFSLIEVVATTILEKSQQTEQAKKLDRYCRIIFPAIFAIASIAIFARMGE
jgi:hypothetical protein